MAVFRVDEFRFDLSLSVWCEGIPSALPKTILPAVRATLERIPRKELAKRLTAGEVYSLSAALVTAPQIHELNRTYRGKDRPTDVLSFSRLEGPRPPHPEIGDVIVCWEVAKRQAEERSLSTEEELRRLTVHGVLHLLGYDHEVSPREARRMFRLQNLILKEMPAIRVSRRSDSARKRAVKGKASPRKSSRSRLRK